MKRSFWLLLALALTACYSTSPAALNVRITEDPEVVRGCEFKGNVHAMGSWGTTFESESRIKETLKERTHKLGANVVYVRWGPSQNPSYENSPQTITNDVGSARGEAYLCPAE